MIGNIDTYDPIVEEIFPKAVRLLDRLESPSMDTALVLEPRQGDPVLVSAGEKVPGAVLGRYRRAARVTLRVVQCRFVEDDIPTADPGFLQSAEVRFTCQVTDPVEIVRSGIRDMTRAVQPSLAGIMSDVLAEFDVSEYNTALKTLKRELEALRGRGGIALGNFHVKLLNKSEYYDHTRDMRIESMRRRDMRGVVDGGREELIAQHLVKNDGDPTGLLAAEAEAVDRDKDRMIEMVRISTDEDADPVEMREARRHVFGKIFGDPAMLRPPERKRLSRREHIASRREGGPAEVTAGGEAEPVEPLEPRELAPPPPPPASEKRVSRLRGSATERRGE